MSIVTKVDEHGVKEYRNGLLLVCTVLSFILINYGGGYALYYFENGHGIDNFWDAEWTVFNTMTTIGYGDFSASTDGGRITTKVLFFLGALNIGAMVRIGYNILGTDKSVKNRELRTAINELLRKGEVLEEHLGVRMPVGNRSHYLDDVFEQVSYSSKALRDGWLTIGKDSSGMYMMSVVAYDRETNKPYHRWLSASSRDELYDRFYRYQEKDNEL